MKKYIKILTAAAIACLLIIGLTYTGCKKAGLEESQTGHEQLIAAQEFSNSDLVHFIKHEDPPLSDQDLMGIMIAASPLDDNIIKELLKRGQPPANAPVGDETLQMIVLFNLPLSDHILSELEKDDISLSRSLVDNINLNDLPDMELKDANLLMESLLNLKFGDGLSLFHKVEPVTTNFQVLGNLDAGQYFVLGQDFLNVIGDMILECVAAPGTITTPCISKHIIAVDLEITTSEDPFTGNKIFDVDLTAIVGLELPQPAAFQCAFSATKAFKAFGATDCDLAVAGTGGTCIGQFPLTDAAEEIEIKVNTNTCNILNNCVFFANIQTATVEGGDVAVRNPTDPGPLQVCPTPDDNIYDFLLFHSSDGFPFDQFGGHHDCVDGAYFGAFAQDQFYETNELTFYLQGTLQAADIMNPLPFSHKPFTIDLIGCRSVVIPNEKLFHRLKTWYSLACGLPSVEPVL